MPHALHDHGPSAPPPPGEEGAGVPLYEFDHLITERNLDKQSDLDAVVRPGGGCSLSAEQPGGEGAVIPSPPSLCLAV